MANTKSNKKLDLSVLVPVFNESGAIEKLINEINSALDGYDFEIVIVDDKSTDNTVEILQNLKLQMPHLRIIKHEKNAGQSCAFMSGVRAANGPIIATLDGDGQNDPADIPKMYRQLMRADAPQNLALVSGIRAKRLDSQAKIWASKIANGVRMRLLNDGAVDTACALKVYKRDIYLTLPYFDHMHRYIPALLRYAGYSSEFTPVNHRHRETGVSKYTNIGRLLDALTDLLGVIWLSTRRRNPGNVKEV